MKHLGWIWAMALVLSACGGGGADTSADTSGTASAAETGAAATDNTTGSTAGSTAADTPSTTASEDKGGASSPTPESSRFTAGTYVGHWLGYDYGMYTGMSTFTAGGSLLRFSAESYGKLKAVGMADVLSHESTQPTVSSDRLSIGLAGDLYSDNNIYALGTSFHLFNEMVSGSYDPTKKRLALSVIPTQNTNHYFDTCKYCDRGYFLPPKVYAFYSPVGTASPAGFRLTQSGNQLQWTGAAGVEHWMVSVFAEDEVRGQGRDDVTTATLPYPSDLQSTMSPPLDFHYSEFESRMMRPASVRSLTLPALTQGKRYVGVISGFGPLWQLYGSNEATAYASVRWTAR